MINVRTLINRGLAAATPDHPGLAWSRLAIIGAVCFLSLVLAVAGNVRLMVLVFGAVAGIPLVLLFLRMPPVGLAVLFVAAFFVPSPLSGGSAGAIHPAILMTALLTGLWIFDMIVRQKRFYIVATSTNLPLFVLMIVAVIALLNGQLNYYSLARLASPFAQISELAVFILSGCAFLLAANQLKTELWLKRLVWVFLSIGAFYILGRITHQTERYIRPLFQVGADSSIFWIWLVSLSGSQALLNRDLSRGWRTVLGGLMVATLYVAVIQNSFWKSGWLPSLAALGVIVFLGFPRYRPLVVAVGMVVGIQYVLGSSLFVSDEDYSILTRVEAWKLVLNIVKANPVLGLGLSNYYWYTPLFPILGYAVNYNSHNNYIDLIAQTGLVGLVCFLWLMAAVGWLGWRMQTRTSGGFAHAYVIGAIGGLAGMVVSGMLGDWVLPFVYNVGLVGLRSSLLGWFFLGGLVLIEQLYPVKRAS